MARLHSIPVEKWDDEFRELMQPDLVPPVQRTILGIYANAPEVAKPFFAFSAAMSQAFTLRKRLLELVRLRIAFHNQCRSCMAMRYEAALDDGLTEDLVCSLEKPVEAPDLTDAEKAALQYADLSATNHLAITDNTVANLRKYYSEKKSSSSACTSPIVSASAASPRPTRRSRICRKAFRTWIRRRRPGPQITWRRSSFPSEQVCHVGQCTDRTGSVHGRGGDFSERT